MQILQMNHWYASQPACLADCSSFVFLLSKVNYSVLFYVLSHNLYEHLLSDRTVCHKQIF